MSRKTLFIVVAILIALFAAVFYFFFRPQAIPPEEIPGGETCLVFQDIDPNQPCFYKGLPAGTIPVATSTLPGTSPTASSTATSSVATPIDSVCGQSSSAFEKNDCISTVAKERNDKTICDYVIGSLAQDACRRDVSPPATVSAKPSPTYQDFVEQYFSIKPSAPSSTNVIPNEAQVPSVSPSDEAKVRYNLSYGAPLVVYAASRYQVLPGSSLKIYGSGFAPSGNVLNIGTTQSTLNSADGSTLDAVAPGSTGEYEIWVTNQKGSSRVGERPVKLTVTNSPVALPIIEKATPTPVPVDGTVELSGSGFASSNNILTSLGTLMNVPSADGKTISISISSLPYISYAKAAPALKGKISPVLVNIQTPGGVSEKIFQFNVQF